MVTKKEKLIELLIDSSCCPKETDCEDCEYRENAACREEMIADYLIANGVVVLPCKVGDTVFCIRKNPYAKGRYVKENTAYRVSFCVDGYISIFSTKEDVLGKTVFLTRKEAEAALKKMEGEK